MSKAKTTAKPVAKKPGAKEPGAKKPVAKPPVAKKAATPKGAAKPPSATQRAHLIEVGARHSTDKLLTFAATVLAQVGAHAGFATFGFDAAWVARTQAQIDAIDAAATALSDARSATLPGATALTDAIAAAKQWRRDAATSVMLAAIPHHFTPTGSSVPGLMRSVTDLLALIGDASATPFGGGPKKKSEGTALLAALKKARAAHVTELAKLSPAQADLQAQKGALYESLNRLARAARNVMPGQASAFATSTHLATGRHHKAPAAPPGALPAAPAKAASPTS